MKRIWFYPPQRYWYGWLALIPAYIGSDEYGRPTLMLGWTVTGRAVIAIGHVDACECRCGNEADHEALDGRLWCTPCKYAAHPTCECSARPVDVDAILASLGPEFDDPGDDPWGGGNLEPSDAYDDKAP